MSLTKEDHLRLSRICGFDFAKCKTDDELLQLFRKYLQEVKSLKSNKEGERDLSKVLDFSGNMSIFLAVLEKLYQKRQIILKK